MPERALRSLRPVEMRLREEAKRAKVKLADGKARNIQHMMMTSFWHPDGTPMSSQQFMEMLFGKLPEFFHNEAELRTLWSAPTLAPNYWKPSPPKASATINLPKCNASSTPTRATSSTSSPTSPTPSPPSPAKSARRMPDSYRLRIQRRSRGHSSGSSWHITSARAWKNSTRRN
jgi:hypothetical protein